MSGLTCVECHQHLPYPIDPHAFFFTSMIIAALEDSMKVVYQMYLWHSSKNVGNFLSFLSRPGNSIHDLFVLNFMLLYMWKNVISVSPLMSMLKSITHSHFLNKLFQFLCIERSSTTFTEITSMSVKLGFASNTILTNLLLHGILFICLLAFLSNRMDCNAEVQVYSPLNFLSLGPWGIRSP